MEPGVRSYSFGRSPGDGSKLYDFVTASWNTRPREANGLMQEGQLLRVFASVKDTACCATNRLFFGQQAGARQRCEGLPVPQTTTESREGCIFLLPISD